MNFPSHALLVFLDFLDATSATAAVATAVAAAPVTGAAPWPLPALAVAVPRSAGAGAGEPGVPTKAPRYEAPRRPPRALNVTVFAIGSGWALHRLGCGAPLLCWSGWSRSDCINGDNWDCRG